MFIGTSFARTAKTTVNYVNPVPSYDTVTLQDAYVDETWARTVPISANGVEWDNLADWDYYTLFRATYKKSPYAGNIEYKAEEVMYIKVKRRFTDDISSTWQTIYIKGIDAREDFNIDIMDYLEPSNHMVEYLYVPVSYSESEFPHDETKSTKVFSTFSHYFIIDRDKPYPAIIDAETAPNMNVPVEVLTPFGSRYPYVIRKGLTQYRSGTMTASYIEMNCCENSTPRTHWVYDQEADEYYEEGPDGILDMDNAWRYRNEVEDFIANGHVKLIKSPEGDLWLVSMSQAPSRSRNGDYRYVTTSFDWVEVGDPLKAKDLYDAGLLDVDIDAEVSL